jgi:hypothetical protein
MRGLLRSLAFAAAGFAVASLYRQWTAAQQHAPQRHRVPLETWEGEGGALPDFVSSDAPQPASADRLPTQSW